MPLMPPVLSAADPLEGSEGSVDPFATQAAYERLAERILPFLTVRMRRPRFLTAMCASVHVCSEFSDRIAADGVTPPWLVLEWYVVEAHVRMGQELTERDRLGFPGLTKLRRSVDAGRAVGASAYLKTAAIFGFHGIYRRLATGLRILTDTMELDEGGWELLRAWEREQGLDGFTDGRSGQGADFRQDLRRGVEEGLTRGHTSRPDYWKPWKLIPAHLRPSAAGANEARLLYDRLMRTDVRPNPRDPEALAMRREVVEAIRRAAPDLQAHDERMFFRSLMKDRSTSAALRERLDAIEAYELLCRPIHDALNLVLFLSSERGGVAVAPEEFARHKVAAELPGSIAAACRRAMATPLLLEAEPDVQAICERYAGVNTPQDAFAAMLEHHTDAQHGKPPDGKRPWVERVRGDHVVARPQYVREASPDGKERFVHDYRTESVSLFLRDLRRFGK